MLSAPQPSPARYSQPQPKPKLAHQVRAQQRQDLAGARELGRGRKSSEFGVKELRQLLRALLQRVLSDLAVNGGPLSTRLLALLLLLRARRRWALQRGPQLGEYGGA
jgi:hypothetical protein